MNPKRCKGDILKGYCGKDREHNGHKVYTKNTTLLTDLDILVMYQFEKVYATDARINIFIRASVAYI